MIGKKFRSFLLVGIVYLFFSRPLFAAGPFINEFLPHSATGEVEWVEIYNPDGVDLSAYFVDDDTSFTEDIGSTKKSLSSLNSTNPQYSYIELSSFLNNDGDIVALFSSNGTLVDQYQYDKDPGTGVVIGRSPDGSGGFVVLASATKGNPNSAIAPSPTPSDTPTPKPPTPTPTLKSPTPTKLPTSTPTAKPPTPTKSEPTSKPIPTTKPNTLSAPKYDTTSPVVAIAKQKVKPTQQVSDAVLGTTSGNLNNTLSSTPHPTKSISKTQVQGVSVDNRLSFVLVGSGVIALLICGILSFRIYRKNSIE